MKSNKSDAAAKREYIADANLLEQQYLSQHCGRGDPMSAMLNTMFDSISPRYFAENIPAYRSGVNPNFFEEFFSSTIGKSNLTNTQECRAALWNEYQSRRWSYALHLQGYHMGTTQKKNHKVTTIELLKRLRGNAQSSFDWYFDKSRKRGDINHSFEFPLYTRGLSVLHSDFANCPVPKQTLTFGSVHVAVGFNDLGILIDSTIVKPKNEDSGSLLFRGFEANPFSVAKSLVLWEMMKNPEIKPCWVVQVWFSSVWSKKATNSFLATARHVAHYIESEPGYPFKVTSLVQHWAQSKGVGLKKIVHRRVNICKESSDALFFATPEDRIEAIQYHFTGMFGLAGEEPCSSSITMFDCPEKGTGSYANESNTSVFHTLTLRDVLSSDLFNGNYFQSAEKVKERRVSRLMEYIQAGKIEMKLSVDCLSAASDAQVKEIQDLKPTSMSWSNILDYMPQKEFHTLARSCSNTATHVGCSMNWPGVTFGASLIDYPDTSLNVILKAERATAAAMRKLCGQRRIFLLPIQHNPLNITQSFLAEECHKYWIQNFFSDDDIKVLGSGLLNDLGNPLSKTGSVVSCSWNYSRTS